MPGGEPDPMVTAKFLDDVRACTWSQDRLVAPTGLPKYPQAVGRRAEWEIHTAGVVIAQSTYTLLCAGTANPDGSFTSGGTTYWLRDDSGRALAVPV